jgi:hypothetical protein
MDSVKFGAALPSVKNIPECGRLIITIETFSLGSSSDARQAGSREGPLRVILKMLSSSKTLG